MAPFDLPEGLFDQALVVLLGQVALNDLRRDHHRQIDGFVADLLQRPGGFELNLAAMSLLSLIVGMFLIYNTVSASVARRRREIGILRSLGVTRNEVRALFLGEAVVLGSIGAFLGLAGGLLQLVPVCIKMISIAIKNINNNNKTVITIITLMTINSNIMTADICLY